MAKGELNWNWDEKTDFILDDVNETIPEDKLNRRRYAEYLYFYLKDAGENKNTVVNLNAEWGAGKTYFLRRFYNSIKDLHPCVYIDAWKQDFSDDAFLTLFSSLSSQLKNYPGNFDEKLISCGQSIGRLTKGVIPAVLSGLTTKFTGVENVGAIAKEAAQLMLQEHQEKIKAIQSLKKELILWSRLAIENRYPAPIFIFVDELDRCRPDYAVSLLEIVKHIFDIDKFVFLIATDTDQLQHSIKNIYGNDFSANDYLGRFFHRRFTLKSPKLKELITVIIKDKIGDDFDDSTSKAYPLTETADNFAQNISEIFEAFSLNLRDSIRNTERLIDILKSDLIKKRIDYILLLSLMIIYDKDRHIIDSEIGRSPVEHTFSESIRKSTVLKGASQARIKLNLDTNQQKIGVNYINQTLHSKTLIAPFNSNIELSLVQYLESALDFIRNIERHKEEVKINMQSSLMIIRDSPASGNSILKYLYGAMLVVNDDIRINSFKNYVELIELATSFD